MGHRAHGPVAAGRDHDWWLGVGPLEQFGQTRKVIHRDFSHDVEPGCGHGGSGLRELESVTGVRVDDQDQLVGRRALDLGYGSQPNPPSACGAKHRPADEPHPGADCRPGQHVEWIVDAKVDPRIGDAGCQRQNGQQHPRLLHGHARHEGECRGRVSRWKRETARHADRERAVAAARGGSVTPGQVFQGQVDERRRKRNGDYATKGRPALARAAGQREHCGDGEPEQRAVRAVAETPQGQVGDAAFLPRQPIKQALIEGIQSVKGAQLAADPGATAGSR